MGVSVTLQPCQSACRPTVCMKCNKTGNDAYPTELIQSDIQLASSEGDAWTTLLGLSNSLGMPMPAPLASPSLSRLHSPSEEAGTRAQRPSTASSPMNSFQKGREIGREERGRMSENGEEKSLESGREEESACTR